MSQASSQVGGKGSVSLALPSAASAPGTLLIATVLTPDSTPFSPPAGTATAGWQLAKAVQCAGGRVEQWYWANNPGGLYGPGAPSPNPTAAVFQGVPNIECRGGIAEFASPAGSMQVLDTLGQVTGNGIGAAMKADSAAGVFAGSLGVFSEAQFFSSGSVSGASWQTPGGYTHLASLANVLDNWAWSYAGDLAAGYQHPAGGFSYSGSATSSGWAALTCCYRAVAVSPINWCGAEVTNCLALDPTGQQLIVGGDVEGIFRTANFGDNWQPSDFGIETAARQCFAFVAWSELEPGVVYAGGGHSPGNGAFLASTDGGATWSQRNTDTSPIWWYGAATPSPPRPSGIASDQDRSVGRMLAQDPAASPPVLYSATGSDGVMKSTDFGATWVTIGLNGSDNWPRCIVNNPANPSELWVGAWFSTDANGNSLGGVWHYDPVTQAWAQLGGYTGTVADLKIVGTGSSAYLYAACDTGGIYRAPVAGGSLVSLNGAPANPVYGGTSMNAIDTSGSSLWVSLDGYADGSGHHVIAGCSVGVKVSSNFTNIVRLTLPGGGTANIGYTDLTGPNQITINTFPPFGTPWWHATSSWQSWLGGDQNGNPHILIDPTDPSHQRIYLTGHGGFFRSFNGGTTWELACNGMTIIALHSFAIDPHDGSHFVTCGDDYVSYDFTDPTGASGISATSPPGSGQPGIGLESHGAAFDGNAGNPRLYLAQNEKFGVNDFGAVAYRPATRQPPPSPDPFPWTTTNYGSVTGSAAPMGLHAGIDASKNPFVLALAQGKGIYRWTDDTTGWGITKISDGSQPGLTGKLSSRVPTCPFAADAAAGVIYLFDRPTGLYCSLDYGQTWFQVWNKTNSDDRTGWLAPHPTTPGLLWLATDTGLFKLTNASGGTVSAGQVHVTSIGGVFSAGASGIAYAPSGALYAIGLGGSPSPPAPQFTTLYVSADGSGATSSWSPVCNGDGSDTSYGSPGGMLGISTTGYLWAASGIHVGYWDRVS